MRNSFPFTAEIRLFSQRTNILALSFWIENLGWNLLPRNSIPSDDLHRKKNFIQTSCKESDIRRIIFHYWIFTQERDFVYKLFPDAYTNSKEFFTLLILLLFIIHMYGRRWIKLGIFYKIFNGFHNSKMCLYSALRVGTVQSNFWRTLCTN